MLFDILREKNKEDGLLCVWYLIWLDKKRNKEKIRVLYELWYSYISFWDELGWNRKKRKKEKKKTVINVIDYIIKKEIYF